MKEHEIRDWLAGLPATDEQMDQLATAADLAERFDDDADGTERAFTTMAQIILGDETIDGLTDELATAEAHAADARIAVYAGITWAIEHQGASEAGMTTKTGIGRSTIRRFLGK